MSTTKPAAFPVTIEPLETAFVDQWISANIADRGMSEIRRLSRLWDDAQRGDVMIWAAWGASGECLGHVMLVWQSDYTPFRRQNIPEITDLWVQPEARRQGVARQLLAVLEDEARKRGSAAVGLGVGVADDFLAARTLYNVCGYTPDEAGVIDQPDQKQTMWVKRLGNKL